MANEYKLPSSNLESDIKHLKRLSIYVTADKQDPVQSLRLNILGYTAADRDESGGTVVATGQWPTAEINTFLNDNTLGVAAVAAASQLDFALQEKCFVTLKLVGDFWQFSRLRDPITTKQPHADNRYYQMRRHVIGGRVRGISFCAKNPLQQNPDGSYERHGVNLYVDFLQDTFQLPVIVDPDIENKGGHP